MEEPNREQKRKLLKERCKYYTQPYKNGRTRDRARKYYWPPRKRPEMVQGAPPPPIAKQPFSLSKMFTKVRDRMRNIKNKSIKG